MPDDFRGNRLDSCGFKSMEGQGCDAIDKYYDELTKMISIKYHKKKKKSHIRGKKKKKSKLENIDLFLIQQNLERVTA